jgi:hypothetical protein
MLSDRAADFSAALERLDGRAEWGVKAVADPAALEAAASEPAAALAGGPGAAYIARKKQAAAAADAAERVVATAVRDAHERLCELASAAVLLRAQNRELSGHRGEMVFNAAYLVDEERGLAFAAAVEELGGDGVCFELTGPWPPYNFAEAPG